MASRPVWLMPDRGNAMALHRRVLLMAAALLAPARAAAHEGPDPRGADPLPAGAVCVGVHLPQFTREPATGDIDGHGTGVVIVQIAQALADRVGGKLKLVGHRSPPALVECLKAGACDVGFLGYVPNRTTDVAYAPPHM